MSLTKKQISKLNYILGNIQRAYNYLDSDKVQGIAHVIDEHSVNGGDYTIVNKDACEILRQGKHIRVMNKYCGSDIAGLSQALDGLKNFIENNTKKG